MKDREILRPLAARVREIAELPEQAARRHRLAAHNALRPERPIILAYPEGAWTELLPAAALQCENEKLRDWEARLRRKIYWWEHLRDDNALEPFFNIGWHIKWGDYGFKIAYEHGANRGSYTWVAPLQDIESGFHRLKSASHTVDREGAYADVALANELFGDLPTFALSRLAAVAYLVFDGCGPREVQGIPGVDRYPNTPVSFLGLLLYV